MDLIKCDKCDSENGEMFLCERCLENYCEDCSATFDKFTQIDYNCCSTCSNKNFSDDSDF